MNVSLADGDNGDSDDNDFKGTKRDRDGDSFPKPGGGPDNNNKLMLKMMTMMIITDW